MRREKNAQRPRRPQEARRGTNPAGRKDGERRRQRHDGWGSAQANLSPSTGRSRPDPPETETQEAHPPAGSECGAERGRSDRTSRPAFLGAVDQPDRDDQRNGDQRGTAKEAGDANAPCRAREEGDGAPPPAPRTGSLPSMSQDRPFAGGAAVESAMLKLPRLLVARIASFRPWRETARLGRSSRQSPHRLSRASSRGAKFSTSGQPRVAALRSWDREQGSGNYCRDL